MKRIKAAAEDIDTGVVGNSRSDTGPVATVPVAAAPDAGAIQATPAEGVVSSPAQDETLLLAKTRAAEAQAALGATGPVVAALVDGRCADKTNGLKGVVFDTFQSAMEGFGNEASH